MSVHVLWPPGRSIRVCLFVMFILTTFELILFGCAILCQYVVIDIPDVYIVDIYFMLLHAITWIMGYTIAAFITNLGYHMMYAGACIVNFFFEIIFFSLVAADLTYCLNYGFDVCGKPKGAVWSLTIIFGGLFITTLMQLVVSCMLSVMIRRRENSIIITLQNAAAQNYSVMNKERIDSYMEEPPSIRRTRLVMESLSIVDFWTTVVLFIIALLDLSPTVTIQWLFIVFIGHTISGVMGFGIGIGIENVTYMDWYVVIHLVMIFVEVGGLVGIVIILQLECNGCSYILYVITWIEFALGMILLIKDCIASWVASNLAEMVYVNTRAMKIDKNKRLGNVPLVKLSIIPESLTRRNLRLWYNSIRGRGADIKDATDYY